MKIQIIAVSILISLLCHAETLFPINIRQMYVEPGKTATLHFIGSGNIPEQPKAELFDYNGQLIQTIQGKKITENGTYEFSFVPQRGFYELEIPGAKHRFGILALETLRKKPDPFFSMEPLLIHRQQPDHIINENLDMLKRYGIISFREYHSFQNEKQNPVSAPWKDRFFELATQRNMKGVFFIGHSPQWLGAGSSDRHRQGYQPYPTDLAGFGDALTKTLNRWLPAIDAFQIWNEPDLQTVPCDQYLSLEAMASAVMAQQKLLLPLAGAGFSHLLKNPIPEYMATAQADFIDIFSFHNYLSPETIVEQVAYFRKAMEHSGKAGMPFWITECGKPWSRGIVARTAYGGPSGKLRANPEEDRISGCFITMKGVEAKAAGVARYFPFALKYFPENNYNFGMVDQAWTPHRSLAAYLNSIRELAGFDYIGDAANLPDGVKIMRIFSDGVTVKAIPYTGKDEAIIVDFAALPVLAAYSPDGRQLPLNGKKLEINGGFAYITLDAKQLSGQINADTTAMRLLRQAKKYQPVPRKSSPVVYQFHHWKVAHKNKTFYNTAPETLIFTVYNFSDKEQTASPELEVPGDIRVLNAPGKICLAPGEHAELVWKLDARQRKEVLSRITLKDMANNSMPLPLKFFDIAKTVPLHMELNNATRWKANSAGEMTISADNKEHAIHFQVQFDKNDPKRGYWIYPEYILEKPRESFAGAVAISFDLKAKQGDGYNNFVDSNVMITYDGSERYYLAKFPHPTAEWQHYVVPFPQDWDTAKINRLRIGLNTISDRLEFSLRNVGIHFLPKSGN